MFSLNFLSPFYLHSIVTTNPSHNCPTLQGRSSIKCVHCTDWEVSATFYSGEGCVVHGHGHSHLLLQGLLISITYCFLNDEVQRVLRTHWRRAMMVRRVGREGRQRRHTLTTSLRISYCETSQCE